VDPLIEVFFLAELEKMAAAQLDYEKTAGLRSGLRGLFNKTKSLVPKTRLGKTLAAGGIGAGVIGGGIGTHKYLQRAKTRPAIGGGVGPTTSRGKKILAELMRRVRRKFPHVPEDKIRQLILEAMREHGVS
jgi:hypothetical protein